MIKVGELLRGLNRVNSERLFPFMDERCKIKGKRIKRDKNITFLLSVSCNLECAACGCSGDGCHCPSSRNWINK